MQKVIVKGHLAQKLRVETDRRMDIGNYINAVSNNDSDIHIYKAA